MPEVQVTPASYWWFITATTACSWPPAKPVRLKYFPRLGIDADGAELGARNQVARRAVRVGPGQRMTLHVLERHDAAVAPGIEHRDIGRAAVRLLRRDER